ncbi:MAG TPA: ATP-grasp domain-containing protein, partial [Candidatus Dormibacteraeota bacterium]|nr:ATP-grasp domain-containing protein [Candidatus Dormibacteraeota bacterium]
MAANVLLVLPVRSYRAAAFLAAGRAIGARIVLATDRASSIGGTPEVIVDLDDPDAAAEAVAAFAEGHPVHGVVGVDETAVLPAAAIAARLGLRHHPVAAVAATRDKRLMRRRAAERGLRQPAFAETRTGAGPAALEAAAGAVGGFPVVVKPVSLAASQGVLRADDPAALDGAARRIGRLLDRLGCAPADGAGHPLLVESFLPGREVAIEGIVRGGRLEVLRIFDKPDGLDGPTFAETLYVAPSRLTPAVQAAVAGLVAGAVSALGLDEGPVHAEVRVDPMTGPALVEVAARSIGGLCSQAVRVCAADPDTLRPTGEPMSLEEVILRHALGMALPDRLTACAGAAGVLMLPVERAGRLVAVDGVAAAAQVAGVDSVSIGVAAGTEVEPLPEGDR